MDNTIAKKIFPFKFNIVNIYSPYGKEYLKNIYSKHNIKIMNWQDRLPFFNKLFFGIYEKISFIYVIVFSMLVIIFMIFFLSSLLDDIKISLKQILYYGNSFLYSFLVIFFVVLLFGFTIFYLSYIGFYVFDQFVVNYILINFEIHTRVSFHSSIVNLTLLMAVFSFLYTLYYKYKKES